MYYGGVSHTRVHGVSFTKSLSHHPGIRHVRYNEGQEMLFQGKCGRYIEVYVIKVYVVSDSL